MGTKQKKEGGELGAINIRTKTSPILAPQFKAALEALIRGIRET